MYTLHYHVLKNTTTHFLKALYLTNIIFRPLCSWKVPQCMALSLSGQYFQGVACRPANYRNA